MKAISAMKATSSKAFPGIWKRSRLKDQVISWFNFTKRIDKFAL